MDSQMMDTVAEPLEKDKGKEKAKAKGKGKRIVIAKGITMTKIGLHFVPQPDMTPEDYKARRFVERDFMNHGIHFLTKEGYKPMPMPNNTPPKRKNRFDDECYYTDDSGVMRPTTLSGESKKTAIEFGKLAVEYHNNQILKKGGKEEVMLEFVRPLKMNTQVVAGFNYYITLEAKDVGAPSHQSRIYQTLVFAGITVTKVRSFSLKSTGSEKCCAKEERKIMKSKISEEKSIYMSGSSSNDARDKIPTNEEEKVEDEKRRKKSK